ncbi:MAG TPA: hypothetical protein PK528_11585 [Syntrophorhabdus sp.]|jgi:hypothetical protein|nr:hypothetical protein [Syntrophorhabdus sp.]
MRITGHAIKRLQQRGISKEIAELILLLGEPIAKPGGLKEYRLTQKAKAIAQSDLKRKQILVEKACNKGVLVDEADDTIITAYHII